MTVDESVAELRKFVRLLEWRIEQHETAALFWRQISVERGPAVDLDCLRTRLIPDVTLERRIFFGLQLAENHAIAFAAESACDQRRAGIAFDGSPRVFCPDERKIRLKQRTSLARKWVCKQTPNALPP